MRKWAESTTEIIPRDYITGMLAYPETWPEEIPDSECDGVIESHCYHDGTLLFTKQTIQNAVEQVDSGHCKQVGQCKLVSDYVIHDMSYRKGAQVTRVTVTIPFKWEQEG